VCVCVCGKIEICTKLKENKTMRLIRIMWFLSIWSYCNTRNDGCLCDII